MPDPSMSKRGKTVLRFIPPALVSVLALFVVLDVLFPLPPPKPYSLLVQDRHGEFLQAFLTPDGMWRLKTSPGEIPAKLKKILIAREDRYFYYHPGVNPVSIIRALIQNTLSGRRMSGASTITMQVARMLEPKERTYFHKLVEAFRALQLERRYTKDEILEMYISIVPLGGNVEGLRSAALIYYQTPLERLNIAQLLDLILIPNDPNGLRPDRHPERLLAQRREQSRPLFPRGLLSGQDSIVIWQTPAAATRKTIPSFAPHFCLRVRDKMRNAADVRSSLDLKVQRTVETLLSGNLRLWMGKGVRNGAVIVLDNRTREVLAYAGSGDFNDSTSHGQVDAVRALRSPGSAMKPFLYAMLMDKGTLTPKTRLLDTPYDAEGFLAENYDGKYSGLVYADEALRRSLNVPIVRLLKEVGVPQFVDFAVNAGVASLDGQREHFGLSVILGGCGVTLEEMTAAYACFPSSGAWAPPVVLRQDAPPAARQVFSPSAAFMVTDILAGLDRPDLPNNFASSLNLPKVAFKTGTSYGRRDAWSIGYSAEYTVGVWMGNVDQKGSAELTGGKAAAPLLIDIFNSISTPNQKSILPMPSDVQIQEVCANSGLLPTPRCTHLIDDYYSVRHTLERFCTVDKEYLVSYDGKVQYCPSCLGSNHYRIRTYQEYPPELFSFWGEVGRSYARPPAHNPACTRAFTGDGPKIVSPSAEMTYYFVSPQQKLSLQACSGLEVRAHCWYVDDEYVGREKANSRMFVRIGNGEHTITCVDDRGRMSSVKVIVRYAL